MVELMVALIIGLALSAAAAMIYSSGKRAFVVHGNMARILESGRSAMFLMKEDIRLAGYWGLNYLPSSIVSAEPVIVGNECTTGWSTEVSIPIDVLNNSNDGYADCIPDADHEPGTDVLTVRHSASEPTLSSAIAAGDIYLHTSLTRGVLFVADTDGMVDAGIEIDETPLANYRVYTHAYYIRPWSVSRADGIPTLVREAVAGTRMVAEPLVEYVQDFQITLGLDTDTDGNVDRYSNQGFDPADSANLMTVTVEILVRSPSQEADYINRRIYTLGNKIVTTVANSTRKIVERL